MKTEVPEEQTENYDDLAVDIEYVGETPSLEDDDPNFQYFARIFNVFKV